MTKSEYTKVMFVGLYKKPAFILATFLGLYMITTVIFDYLKLIDFYDEAPFFEIICGTFLLLAPSLIVVISVRQFLSNPNFQNDIKYTFDNNGISLQGLTFSSEFLWTHIIKQKELDKFLILYHTKKFGYFIDKTKLTTEQLDFIKPKIKQK